MTGVAGSWVPICHGSAASQKEIKCFKKNIEKEKNILLSIGIEPTLHGGNRF